VVFDKTYKTQPIFFILTFKIFYRIPLILQKRFFILTFKIFYGIPLILQKGGEGGVFSLLFNFFNKIIYLFIYA
jgi:hypothetical protein